MTTNKATTKQTGDLGEAVAARYISERGFTVVALNYRKPWAEIDIIAKKGEQIHFIEVKTVSYETSSDLKVAVARGTWRPEEQVHARKLHQIGKGAETWIDEQSYTGNWQIDVIAIRLVPRETYASVKYIPNVIAD